MKCLKSNYKLFLILIISLIFLKSHAQEHGGCATPEFNEEEEYKSGCDHTSDTWINKYRTPGHWIPDENTPIKTIMVNWIVCRDDNGQNGWQDVPEFHESVSSLFDKVNLEYSTSLPKGYSLTCEPEYTHVEDTRIRFELNEVIFIDKTEFNLGCSATDILDYVFAQYPDARNFLNHIFTQGDAPCIPGAWGRYNIYWEEDVSYVHTWGSMWHEWYADFFDHSYHVIHEYAHAVGLHHVYNAEYRCTSHYDFLDDVFGLCAEAGCNSCGSGNCDGNQVCYLRYDCFWQYNTVNTPIMSAAYDIRYISPKSAGRMHRALSLYDRTFKVNNKPMHKYVKEDHSYEIPLTITENETWDFAIKMYQDIIVEQGATLKISCDVKMPIDGKIIVKPGGKLIIDGGYVTSAHNKLWQGIEVWGNPNASQQEDENGNYQQGYLELMNDATIENAQTAVALRKEGTWASHGGGIVKAYDANFINNAKSVWFAPYQNIVTIGQYTFEADNEALFQNCVFEINEDYFPDSDFYKHADIVQVRKIKFKGCDFTRLSNENTSYYCAGIATYSGSISVGPYGNDVSTFEGFHYGVIMSDNVLPSYNSYINESLFKRNNIGIKLNTLEQHVTIKDNDFYVGYNSPDKQTCGVAQGFGVFLDNTNNFVIKDNRFYKNEGSPEDGEYYGIEAFNTQTGHDEIFRNTFTDLTYANHATNTNWDINGNPYLARYRGLAYYCNEHINNENDLFFTWEGDPEIEYLVSGVQIGQGNEDRTAGNTFTSNISGYHIYNNCSHGVGYYYDEDISNQIPVEYSSQNAMVTIHAQSLNAQCSDIGIEDREYSTAEKQEIENEFTEKDGVYNSLKTTFESLQDGGNTEAMQTEVSSSWPDDMWELRDQLLGLSPYLSKEVLKTAADKTEVLPESVLFEILSANPDELRKADLMDHLENKEQPLPDYMMDILRQVAAGQSAKTVLQNQMSFYHRDKSRLAHQMLVALHYDEMFDYNKYRLWLGRLGGMQNDIKSVASFVEEGNYSDALALANLFPDLYGLENNELAEYDYYMDLLNLNIALKQQNRSFSDLNDEEYNLLAFVANNSISHAGAEAKGWLEHFYGEHFCYCLNTNVVENKSATAFADPALWPKLWV
jgi:hypothetical protein